MSSENISSPLRKLHPIPKINLERRREEANRMGESIGLILKHKGTFTVEHVPRAARRLGDAFNLPRDLVEKAITRILPVNGTPLGCTCIALAMLAAKDEQQKGDVHWHGVIVLECRKGPRGYQLIMLWTTGQLAGCTYVLNVSGQGAYNLLRDLEVRPKFKEGTPPELTGCWGWVALGAHESANVQLKVAYAPDYCRRHNRKLWTERREKHCVEVAVPCAECPKGRDACPHACRMKSLKGAAQQNEHTGNQADDRQPSS